MKVSDFLYSESINKFELFSALFGRYDSTNKESIIFI